jgi:hypothetical protein
MGNEILEKVTPEIMLNQLKEKVALRDKMGGALYWNILNDKCCEIANKCLEAGCKRSEIEIILGQGTFR